MAKVFLSAGHGGSDPGAVANGLKEKDINLNTMLACNEVLVRHGVTTVLSRTKDENDPVSQEVSEANASGADLAISFHANAGGGDGFEAVYWISSTKGKKLAQLGEKYVKAMGQNSRGIKSGNHLYFIKKTTAPAVLFESFFLDNANDKTIGDTVAEQKAFGVAYAKAILEYLGIAYKEPVTSTPAPAKPATTTSAYYPAYTGTSTGIDTIFKAIGVPAQYCGNYSKRKPVAVANGISNYEGTSDQNIKLKTLAKQGKLKKV